MPAMLRVSDARRSRSAAWQGLALAALLALPPGAALAQAAVGEGGETPLGRLELSARLQAEGLVQDDPLLLLAAARLRHGVDLAPAAGAPRLADWQELLAQAQAAAAADPLLQALIGELGADMVAEGSRGVTTGQVYAIAELAPGETEVLAPLPFEADRYAEVYVEAASVAANGGASDALLTLQVHDSAGRLVCADEQPAPVAYCGWRPAEADEFTIRIGNAGATATGYALMTN